ncbi:MAG: M42 family metallopeptidase [Trueperaceae bacterium]|nr:M42 family metallopeptidase [Trueperaceae bacterium]
MKLLKKLSEANGVPGREEQVRAIIEAELKGVVDELSVDALGNLTAVKKGPKGAPKAMVAAHMDEIGFYVRFIDDRGFVRLQQVGGFDPRNLFAQQVTVHASLSGKELVGVMNPAAKPIHISTAEERGKVPQLSDFYVDLGLDVDDVKAQVRIGDMVTMRQRFEDLGKIVTGKALDDRVGCWILIETLKRLKKPALEVHAVFTVQEEVGLRGAYTSAFRVAPDVGIALDTTLAVDGPDATAHQRVTQMGAGTALKVMDSSAISTRWLLDEFIALADKNKVDYQLEVLPLGGTDAGAMQRIREGVPSITISTPSRYVHTVTEMVAKSDLEAGVKLLTAFLQKGTAKLKR